MPNEQKWIRTCQECGHEQIDKPPDTSKELTTSYRNRKCKKCKSEALDYGSRQTDVEVDFTKDDDAHA
jgi:ribosomal protein S27E